MASFSFSNGCYVVFLIIISLALIGWNPFIGIILTALLVWFLISKSKQDNLKRSMNHHSQQLESCYGPNGLLKCPACGTSTKLSRWIRAEISIDRGSFFNEETRRYVRLEPEKQLLNTLG